ncbi:NADP-dependent oxidoreductase domain-containing protein [Mycena vulgaris]|nr:NADP-dependent oxidoreductase domain-containing protein [Mycena vulgaris]
MSTFPTRQIGRGSPMFSAMGLGTMGLGGAIYGGADEGDVLEILTRVADSGATFWDTADVRVYLERSSDWEVVQKNWRRREIFLSTKFGAKDLTEKAENIWRPNSQPSYIKKRLDSSLALLDPNPKRPEKAKRVQSHIISLSRFPSGDVDLAPVGRERTGWVSVIAAVPTVGEKVVAVQVKFSPFELKIETSGSVAQSRDLGVTIIPDDLWPLMPRFSEENFAANLQPVHEFEVVTKKIQHNFRSGALAWILTAYPDFIPFPGTASVEENVKAVSIKLSADLKGIETVVRNAGIQGERLPAGFVTPTVSISMVE